MTADFYLNLNAETIGTTPTLNVKEEEYTGMDGYIGRQICITDTDTDTMYLFTLKQAELFAKTILTMVEMSRKYPDEDCY